MRIPEFNKSPNIKTVGFMIWLTRALWNTGESVIIYTVFFVLKGLLETTNRGGYGIALIKK